MINYRLILFILTINLVILTFNIECTRYDDLKDEEDHLERMKRFLFKPKKSTTTTKKPSSDALASLFPTTPSNKHKPTQSSSGSIDKYGKKFNDACNSGNPCQNGGSCRTLASGRHYCTCTEQYYGRNCEKKFKSTGPSTKDSCSSSPCLHGGECVPLTSTFYCRCKTPYYGLTCHKSLSKREIFQ
ncbi:hypothetical protein I4U23_031031 [Adineta vaga]|nr:hypothetical protein I4U23_031031 [Adineta vaga]